MKASFHRFSGFRRWWFDRDIRGGIVWWLGLSLFVYMISTLIAATTVSTYSQNLTDSTKVLSIISQNSFIDSVKENSATIKKEIPYNVKQNSTAYNSYSNNFFWIFLAGTFFGIIFWILISLIIRWRWRNREISNGRFSILTNLQTKNEIFSVSIVIVSVLMIFITISILGWNVPVKNITWWQKFIENPGGPFALITGAGTLVGTYFAIKAILDMKHTITSYPQLLDRLTNLINTAPNSKDGIKILSFFILPGNWQVRSKNIKSNFKRAIMNDEKLFKIACLNPSDHLNMLIDIAKKGTKTMHDISPGKVINFQKECEDLLASYYSDNREQKFQSDPVRLRWNDMPSYYFFVSDDRAIIVTPVGLPQINEKLEPDKVEEMVMIMDGKGNLTDLKKNKLIEMIKEQFKRLDDIPDKKDPAVVDTLGFETTDRQIIEKLQMQFDLIIKSAIDKSNRV